MAASRKSGGGNVTLSLANIKRRSGGGWATATIAKRRSGGVWVDIFSAAVSITDRVLVDTQDNPTNASISYTLSNTGSNGFPGEWLTGGTPSDYEAQAVQVSQSLDTGGSVSGTLNTWMNLGTSRTWTVNQTAGAGSRGSTWVIDVSIRRVSDSVVLDTARIELTAQTVAI